MSEESETRRLVIIGLVVTVIAGATCWLVIANPFGRKPDRLLVELELPYVGEGIAAGSPLMMHGVPVGKVSAVSSLPEGAVRVNAELDPASAAGLTDAVQVDFRPANYFGVTAINLMAGQGGKPLRNGARFNTAPIGNFTLQALLSQMGAITDGVITPQLVDVINRATRYTDGLNPLIESLMITAQSLAKVQTVSTEQLLRNATGISVAFPGFLDAATAAGNSFSQGSGLVTFNVSAKDALPGQEVVAEPGKPISEQYWQEHIKTTLDLLANSFFGALGHLLSSHSSDLTPVVNLVQTLTDTVPGLVTPVGLSDTLVELRTRFAALYGGSAEQRALQVHIVLDQIPGVQAPINAMGGP